MHEACVRRPDQPWIPRPGLRLTALTHSGADSQLWCRSKVRLEGTPLKGKGGQALPVLVTPLNESQVAAGDALTFWQSLGYTVSFELTRRGRQAAFTFQGMWLQVSMQP